MQSMFWIAMAAFAGTIAGLVWYIRRKSAERRHAEEARVAAFVATLAATPRAPAAPAATAQPAPPPLPPPNEIAVQKLLFEAARKAGEAGEPALAIQLYARLLSRYPATSFAEPARAAVAALHKKVVKS